VASPEPGRNGLTFGPPVRAAGERSTTKTRSVTSRFGSGSLPLSVSQTRLWYLIQLAPDSPVYNELITIRKTGPLDAEALRRAL
jgi:hypothetical protein